MSRRRVTSRVEGASTVYRLGVDVGGTFTDLLLIDESSGRTHRVKTPSTPADPSEAILTGVAKACAAAGIRPADITRVMHGTTVATNAVLEGKGARVALLVTSGYRQVLQIARSLVPGGLAGWIVWPKPEPLVDLRDTIEVRERIGADGSVVAALDEEALRSGLRVLAGRGIEAVTVALLNAYANDAHERRVAEIVREVLPGLPISLSSVVLPEIREYERTMSAVVNAYVSPVVSRYLTNLAANLRERGAEGDLLVLRSDGGLASITQAAEAPVNLLISGPAGGVTGALWAARLAGHGNLLTLDMGGTSTDVALIEDFAPRIRRETEVGHLSVRAPSVDVRTVGAGGGSIAHVPELTRALRVGPRSAGADPGPAAYGHGGTEATVTDANVVLGYLPAALLGGEMTLDRDAARTAVRQVADAMGVSLERAAAGIIEIVNEAMFGALRLVSVQQGYDPRDFALICFGGAGPLHANALAMLLGSWPVIIPPSPGILNAYGDVTTQLRNEASRTVLRQFSEIPPGELATLLTALREQAAAALDELQVRRSDQQVVLEVDVRYHGQGFELTVPVDETALNGLDLAKIGEVFDAEHVRLFEFKLDSEREIVNVRAIVQGVPDTVPPAELPSGGPDPAAARVRETRIWFAGSEHPAWIYDRARLAAGNRIPGPAIVTEMDSTTLVLPGHVAEADRHGNLLIRPVR
ncbi:MAG TPA: hydantoinase/oxoprolinase family protein [Actinoplanes sp.]|nr:hydantoinase/oxoprolinase family protein [Actinoplanes sp.]